MSKRFHNHKHYYDEEDYEYDREHHYDEKFNRRKLKKMKNSMRDRWDQEDDRF